MKDYLNLKQTGGEIQNDNANREDREIKAVEKMVATTVMRKDPLRWLRLLHGCIYVCTQRCPYKIYLG